jgi:hypothetical protein
VDPACADLIRETVKPSGGLLAVSVTETVTELHSIRFITSDVAVFDVANTQYKSTILVREHQCC